jgi:hypothetical protein
VLQAERDLLAAGPEELQGRALGRWQAVLHGCVIITARRADQRAEGRAGNGAVEAIDRYRRAGPANGDGQGTGDSRVSAEVTKELSSGASSRERLVQASWPVASGVEVGDGGATHRPSHSIAASSKFRAQAFRRGCQRRKTEYSKFDYSNISATGARCKPARSSPRACRVPHAPPRAAANGVGIDVTRTHVSTTR